MSQALAKGAKQLEYGKQMVVMLESRNEKRLGRHMRCLMNDENSVALGPAGCCGWHFRITAGVRFGYGRIPHGKMKHVTIKNSYSRLVKWPMPP